MKRNSDMQNKLNFLRELFEEAVEQTKPSREEAKIAYEYERGNQLPDDVIATLAQRGQPARWENLYKMIGNKISGMKSMTKQEVQVYPRRLSDRDKSDILTKTLRSFFDSTEWFTHKKRADRDLRLAGLEIIEVKLKELDETDVAGVALKELTYEHLSAIECFIDIFASKPDFSDMRYFHHSKLYHKRTAQRIFGEDKLCSTPSNKSDMTRITRTWYRDIDGSIRYAIWSEDEILQDIATPFSELGRFPIAVRKLYYSSSKEYYGMYRDVKPFQDTINNTMLRIINMLGSSKLIIESDAVDDIEEFTDQYNLDSSVSEVRPGSVKNGKIKDIGQNAPLAQLMQMVQDARAQAEKVIGLNSELLGTAVNRMSGYAIENRQNAGLVGLQDYMDCSGAVDVDVAEISIAIMKEHFTAEQVFLISDINGEKQQLIINEYERNENGAIKRKDGEPQKNSFFTIGRYDLILKNSPFARGASAERQKNWTEVMKVMQVANPALIAPLLPVMLRDVDSPEAEEAKKIIDEFMQKQQEQKPQEDPAQQKFALELEKLKAQIQELTTQAQLNNAKAIAATQHEPSITS